MLEQDWTEQIKEVTAKDENLIQLSKTIAQGWLEQKPDTKLLTVSPGDLLMAWNWARSAVLLLAP